MRKTDKEMYYGATPETFEKAKVLRDTLTKAEKLLWNNLKGKKLMGFRFRRQHPIDIFIADFYCHELKLVIEVDGEIHKLREILIK
jgi:very-short-patch-repair endonuclease